VGVGLSGCVPEQVGGALALQPHLEDAAGPLSSTDAGATEGTAAELSQQQVEPLGVAAAATRASVGGGGAVRGQPSRQQAVEMEVVITLGRDMDLVQSLLERAAAGECNSPGLVAAAAAGLFSFGGEAARKSQLQQAADWAEGKVLAKVTLLFPRDADLLQQLLARNALVRCALQEAGPALAVAAAESPLPAVMAELPMAVRELHARWRQHEGGLVFFVNASAATGVSLVTQDGRWFLCSGVMMDSACTQPVMSKAYGIAMGARPVDVPAMQLRMANGEVCRVTQQFKDIRVVLAKGTDHEASCVLDFWCVPGLESLADVILPTVADHLFAGAGVDRVLQRYRYRPHFASEGSLAVAELPVVCHQAPVARAVVAPLVVALPAEAGDRCPRMVEQGASTPGWGGAFRFANESLAAGAALVLPSGVVLLPGRLMLDSASVDGAVAEAWGVAAGMEPVAVPEQQLQLADGQLVVVRRQFQGVGVVLAKGTAQEVSCQLDFWCIPGLERVAQVILPAAADHRFAGLGVDRVRQRYQYRPAFGVAGDLAVAELPVVRHEGPDGLPLVAVGAPAGQVVEESGARPVAEALAAAGVEQAPAVPPAEDQVAVPVGPPGAATSGSVPGPPDPPGHFHREWLVLTPQEVEQASRELAMREHVLGLDRPHESFLPGGEGRWEQHRLWRRLQFGQHAWADELLQDEGPFQRYWEGLGAAGSTRSSCAPPVEPGFDCYTHQPQPPAAGSAVAMGQRWEPGGLSRALVTQLCAVDGYGAAAGLWAGLESPLLMYDGHGEFPVPWPTGVLRLDVRDFLNGWVDRWLAADEGEEALSDADDSSAQEGALGSSGGVWTQRWRLLYELWAPFGAPLPAAASAAAAAGLQVDPAGSLLRAEHVKQLLAIATTALQVMQLAVRLRPTGDARWDAGALAGVRTMRRVLADGVSLWAEWWLLNWPSEVRMVRPPAKRGPSQGAQGPGGMRSVRGRAGTRRLMLLLLSVLLVVSCLCCVGAVRAHQPCGGSFRCQPERAAPWGGSWGGVE
jgi:hypothetical protein